MDNTIVKVPELSVYEKTLLHDNKRLRDHLANIAVQLDPNWREHGYALVSEWMVTRIKTKDTELQMRERDVHKLLDMLGKIEKSSV